MTVLKMMTRLPNKFFNLKNVKELYAWFTMVS